MADEPASPNTGSIPLILIPTNHKVSILSSASAPSNLQQQQQQPSDVRVSQPQPELDRDLTLKLQAVAAAKAKEAHNKPSAAGNEDVDISSPFNVEHITHVQVTVRHPLRIQVVGRGRATFRLAFSRECWPCSPSPSPSPSPFPSPSQFAIHLQASPHAGISSFEVDVTCLIQRFIE